MVLVDAARRLGITAKAHEVRGSDRVLICPEASGTLLTRIGAPYPGQLGGTQDAPHAGTHQHPPATLLR